MLFQLIIFLWLIKIPPPSNISDALLRRLEVAKKAEKIRDDVGFGILMTALWESVERQHLGNGVQLLHDMSAILNAVETGLKALEASKTPDQDLVIERCQAALQYAKRMTEYSRPHSVDQKDLRLGKFQFYKRVVEMQVYAVRLLEMYTMLGVDMGKPKHEQLMDALQRSGHITKDAREIITDKRYPSGTTVVPFPGKK